MSTGLYNSSFQKSKILIPKDKPLIKSSSAYAGGEGGRGGYATQPGVERGRGILEGRVAKAVMRARKREGIEETRRWAGLEWMRESRR